MNKNSCYIIAIDTSYSFASLAIFDEQSTVYQYVIKEKQSHAKSLPLALQKGIDTIGISAKDIKCMAINEGPGSFTGLRVGISLVKGFCFSLDIPLITIDGLQSYAEYIHEMHFENYSDTFVLLNARKNNYYFSAKYQNESKATKSQFASMEAIDQHLKQCERPFVYINDDLSSPSNIMQAVHMKKSIIEKFSQKQFSNILNFEPNYLVNNYLK